MEFPQEKYIEQPYHPTISLLGIYPKEMKSPSWTDICTSMFTVGLFIIVKAWKQFKCLSMNELIYEIVIYMYNGMLSICKKNLNEKQIWKRIDTLYV